ncbi:LppU/SCO3897 family protein [Streptomyces sp. G45]|uniref:LppU/SCO3897 family protein n=1 Tax=Streptomyces sp. G45 TaxID=3406627 RepID=UPI003C1D9B18
MPMYQGGPDTVAPRRSKKKFIFLGVAVVAVAAIAGAAVLAGKDEAAAAEVGDCMSIGNPNSSSDPDLKIVDCGDSKAKYKVAERKSGDNATCDRRKYAQYNQSGSGEDFTLCLEPLKK